jgi:5-methylthioadenosine/S-adenosylhomocysteine deaminase
MPKGGSFEMTQHAHALSRRGFLGSAAAAAAIGLAEGPGAATARRRRRGNGKPGKLPRRSEVTIRNAHVLSMDPDLGTLEHGDVHVRNGKIVAVGDNLRGGGERIDGEGSIVMPGLIDTHWHLWNTLYRSLAGSDPANGYFALNLRNGPHFEPIDTFRGARLALADALSSGITTVHDWSHNIRGPAYADANLRAHQAVGLRARFSYGSPQGLPGNQTIDLDDLERVQREWIDSGRAELVHLGLAGRPPGLAEPSVYRAEFERARELGLPVSYHVHSTRAQAALDQLNTMNTEGMLGPDTQLIHVLYATEAERQLVAESGSPVSMSPWTELLIGYGFVPVNDLLAAGVRLNFSVDTTALSGTADMFSVMRLAINMAHGQAEQEFGLDAERVLELATIESARGLGIAAETGSLTPGKRADLIMVRGDDPNIAPFTDAPNMIVLAAQPANVDTVLADGRVLKRRGRLTALDTEQVVAQAAESLAAVLARAGSAGGSAPRDDPRVGCCG